ncbi:transketolase family protein [Patescibacteria group bacterium]|nr:transketolase family protein [Patescibacteria group bacterium]
MLNFDLKLNEKLFEQDVEKKATRDGFGNGIMELGETNPSVVVLNSDLGESCKVDKFVEKYPQRSVECGVAEQNMAAIAAGLAEAGKIPYINSFAVFSPAKNYETLRTTAVYNKANVKIAGHHAGMVTGSDGATHQATEDIAITRVWPGINIFVPCDAVEAKKATIESAQIEGPVYLRFSREKTPLITTEETPFEKEKIQTYWITKEPKTVIFATGHMVFQALLAAKKLEEEGINVLVANIATIKPLDEKTVVQLAKQTGTAVTCEDHQVQGGMGSAIAEVLSKNHPTKMEFIGLQDTFAESGEAQELLKKYKMNSEAIIEAVKKVLKK